MKNHIFWGGCTVSIIFWSLNTYEGTGKKNGFFDLSGVKSNQIISEGDIMSAQHFGPLLFVTWGIPLYGLYRYVQL